MMPSSKPSSGSRAVDFATAWPGHVVFAGRNITTGGTISWRAEEIVPTASCIKLQVLIALMSEVEKGRLSLDQTIVVKASDLVGGAGVLNQLSPGISMSLRDIAKLMIILSDNSATNIVIDLIGLDPINEVISDVGLKATRLVNRIDFEAVGDDLTRFAVSSAADFLEMLTAIAEGRMLSADSSRVIREIMSQQHYVDLLARKLPYNPYAGDLGPQSDITVAGKTGFVSGFRGDAVIIEQSGAVVVMTAFASGEDPSFLADNAIARFMGDLGEVLFSELTALEGPDL